MKKFLDNKWVKLLFSFSIMGSAIPSIYQDFTYGHQGEWTHYGMMLVGILYLPDGYKEENKNIVDFILENTDYIILDEQDYDSEGDWDE